MLHINGQVQVYTVFVKDIAKEEVAEIWVNVFGQQGWSIWFVNTLGKRIG